VDSSGFAPAILRFTTATYNIKTAADDVHKAMTTPENRIAEARPIQSDTNTTGKQFARGAFHGSIGVK
jgi:hypothetical protein